MRDRDALRAEHRARRRGRHPSALSRAADLVADTLLAMPEVERAAWVGVYRSVRAELPTAPILAGLGARACTPAVLPDRGMVFRTGSALVRGPLGIPEPSGEDVVPDVLIMPGLAFDAAGHRLGQGGGYYDVYLAAREAEGRRPFTVAVGLDDDVVPFVATLPHDRDVDAIVTPTRTVRVRPPIRVTAAVWIRDGRAFAARRPEWKPRGGCWELPGGKVEPGESDAAALARELREELGVDLLVGETLGECVHAYPDGTVHLVALAVRGSAEPEPAEHDAIRWLAAEELDTVAWAPADLPLLEAVRSAIRTESVR